MTKQYFRPQWTCGRYNSKAKVAIMYNLIEGLSFFFEGDSAVVIGELLSVGRGGIVEPDKISEKTSISAESLDCFFIELLDAGLLCDAFPSREKVYCYRQKVRTFRKEHIVSNPRKIKEKLPFEQTSAEAAYAETVGGVTSVMLELTYRCSEKCVHCYNLGATRNDSEQSGRGARTELCIDDYKRIIDELYNLGIVKICLSGGDPFSKSIAWDIVDYIYKKDIAFDVFTNAQNLQGQAERLADYFPRTVAVSIYSGLSEVHDFITRVKGSWQKSVDFVSELSLLAVPVNIKCCIMRPNFKSYYMVNDIAHRVGAVPQFEVCISDSLDGDKCASSFLLLPPEQLEVVLRDNNIPLYVGREVPYYGKGERDINENACGAGYSSLCITPEGNVTPCCAFHTIFGNLKEKSLSDIIDKSEDLKWWRSLKLKDYDQCGKEEFCSYCNLCPGNNFSEHGNVLKASGLNCYIAKNRYTLAKKMMEDGYDPLKGMTVEECIETFDDYIPVEFSRIESHDFSNKSLKVGG